MQRKKVRKYALIGKISVRKVAVALYDSEFPIQEEWYGIVIS